MPSKKLTPADYSKAQEDWSLWCRVREELLHEYDKVYRCPKCGHLLTGLHEQSHCFSSYLNERAVRKVLKIKAKEEKYAKDRLSSKQHEAQDQ